MSYFATTGWTRIIILYIENPLGESWTLSQEPEVAKGMTRTQQFYHGLVPASITRGLSRHNHQFLERLVEASFRDEGAWNW